MPTFFAHSQRQERARKVFLGVHPVQHKRAIERVRQVLLRTAAVGRSEQSEFSGGTTVEGACT